MYIYIYRTLKTIYIYITKEANHFNDYKSSYDSKVVLQNVIRNVQRSGERFTALKLNARCIYLHFNFK